MVQERVALYLKCCDCKFAERTRGGRPVGCLCESPKITSEGKCEDFTFWWTKLPKNNTLGKVLKWSLIVLGAVFLGIPLLIWLSIKFLRKVAPKINKEGVDFLLPRR